MQRAVAIHELTSFDGTVARLHYPRLSNAPEMVHNKAEQTMFHNQTNDDHAKRRTDNGPANRTRRTTMDARTISGDKHWPCGPTSSACGAHTHT